MSCPPADYPRPSIPNHPTIQAYFQPYLWWIGSWIVNGWKRWQMAGNHCLCSKSNNIKIFYVAGLCNVGWWVFVLSGDALGRVSWSRFSCKNPERPQNWCSHQLLWCLPATYFQSDELCSTKGWKWQPRRDELYLWTRSRKHALQQAEEMGINCGKRRLVFSPMPLFLRL